MNKSKENSISLFSNILFTLQTTFKYSKGLLFSSPIILIVRAISNYGWCFVSKFVIDLATNQYTFPKQRLLLIFLGITFASIITEIIRNFLDAKNTWLFSLISFNLLHEINTKTHKTNFENFNYPEYLDSLSKAKSACSTYNGVEGMLDSFFSFLIYFFNCIIGIIIIGSQNHILFFFLLVTAILNGICYEFGNKNIKKQIWDPFTIIKRKIEYYIDISSDFSFGKDIRLFNLKEYICLKLSNLFEKRVTAKKAEQKILFIVYSCVCIFNALCSFCIYYWLIRCVYNGTLTLGNFSLSVSSTLVISQMVTNLLKEGSSILSRNREINDLRFFLSLDFSEHPDFHIPILKKDNLSFEFVNVSFKYPNSNKYILKNISLKITPKEKIALVGLNGAGKSTFVKLLLGLYKPTDGQILLNGIDISLFNREEYFSIFAPVFQDFSIFAFTISENITLQPQDEINYKNLQKALSTSGLYKKISRLSQGYNSNLLKILFENGIDLSGGEKQKLALARALYKESSFYIFDEPTASFDSIAENKIYTKFFNLSKNKSAIFISHRLGSTKFCDTIYFFKDGCITESGKHTELLKQKKDYCYLFYTQAEDYKNEK